MELTLKMTSFEARNASSPVRTSWTLALPLRADAIRNKSTFAFKPKVQPLFQVTLLVYPTPMRPGILLVKNP